MKLERGLMQEGPHFVFVSIHLPGIWLSRLVGMQPMPPTCIPMTESEMITNAKHYLPVPETRHDRNRIQRISTFTGVF